jgi:nitrate reductase NapE component
MVVGLVKGYGMLIISLASAFCWIVVIVVASRQARSKVWLLLLTFHLWPISALSFYKELGHRF